MLDLDGDGLELTPGNGSVLFDHNADGIRTGTGWLGSDDGILVRDLDGNGRIDSGRELFGVETILADGRRAPQGFFALNELNSNRDNDFTAADDAWNQVQVWRDFDQDGVSDDGELFSLDALGISRIGILDSSNTTGPAGTTVNGNFIAIGGSFTRSGEDHTVGSVALSAGAVDLQNSPFYREFTDVVPLTAAAQASPQMGGSGMVRDLGEAMSLGTAASQSLQDSVSAFAAAPTRDAQRALLDDLITDWAASSGRLVTSRFQYNLVSDGTTEAGVTMLTTGERPVNPSFGHIILRLHPQGMEAMFDPPVGPSEMQPTAEGYEVLRRLNVLEVFNGEKFVRMVAPPPPSTDPTLGSGGGGGSGAEAGPSYADATIGAAQIAFLNQAYDALVESIYGALVVQTRLQPYLDTIELTLDEHGIGFDTTALAASLVAHQATQPREALIDLVELNRYATATLSGVGFDGLGLLRRWIDALPAESALRADLTAVNVRLDDLHGTGSAHADIYLGDGGDNHFSAGVGDDIVDGGAGDDDLRGDEGDDVLVGGRGNDLLNAGTGSDTYRFARGWGQDVIANLDVADGRRDVIEFDRSVAFEDVDLRRQGDDLVLALRGTLDRITVAGMFQADGDAGYGVDQIRFADGRGWDREAVKARVQISTDGNDVLYGYAAADLLAGGDGNDTLTGQGGDDVLDGGAGRDQLFGGEGSDHLQGGSAGDVLMGGDGVDLLEGGTGDDALYGDAGDDRLEGGGGRDALDGGAGSDVYRFTRGWGQDTIFNSQADAQSIDLIEFAADIGPDDIRVTRSGDDLVLAVAGGGDRLTVSYHFAEAGGYEIDGVRFADGTQWTASDLASRVLQGTEGRDNLYATAAGSSLSAGEGNDALYGWSGADVLDGGAGNDSVSGGAGADRLAGGDGADTLYGGAGNDVLAGGAGSDTLYAEAGDDVLEGGAGSDTLDGGEGSDTYRFERGWGRDTIYNAVTGGSDVDAIEFGPGIGADDIVATRLGDDLVLSRRGTEDAVHVAFYFGTGYDVGQIRFGDGTTWQRSQLEAMVRQGTDGNDVLHATAGADVLNGGRGNDRLLGNAGADLLDGGADNDEVDGGDGADQLFGGSGRDVLRGGAGNDTLFGQAGQDNLDGGDGNDVLDGGAGDDMLFGGSGSDTYVFARGAGSDTITNAAWGDLTPNKLDVVRLDGLNAADITVRREGDDLMIRIKGASDTLRVASYFAEDAAGAAGYAVQQLRFADGSNWNIARVKSEVVKGTVNSDALAGYESNDTLTGLDGADVLTGRGGNDTLDGSAGADMLYGNEGNDSLKGSAGNDMLDGGSGSDTLDGGAGNDAMSGGEGADTYVFGLGGGNDTINNFAYDDIAAVDKSQLTALNPANVNFVRQGDDLLIRLKASADSLRVQGYFYDDGASPYGYAVDQVRFADGTVWDYAAVVAHLVSGEAIAGATIVGTSAAETLTGTAGDDYLAADAGADVLDGGTGSDTLDGGAGNDTYVFGIGSGQDTISAYDGAVGKVDTVRLTALNAANVILLRDGGDLLLRVSGSDDTLRVANHFANDAAGGYQIDRILFADGTSWNQSTIKSRVRTATAGDDRLWGYATADSISAGTGDDAVYGGAGQDTLDGGAGADLLVGEDGDDMIKGGTQNDLLFGDAGNDVLQGQDGDDMLSGGDGADTLEGGTGSDTLDGGAGNDTYRLARGDGFDTISSYDTASGKFDRITLIGLNASEVSVRRDGLDLLLTVDGSGDGVRVNGHFSNDATAGQQIDQIVFADGSTWDQAAIKARVMVASDSDDRLWGYASADAIASGAGDDQIVAGGGDDVVDGGDGADSIQGEDGSDTLHGGAQDDSIDGGDGDDTLFGDGGSDVLYGGIGDDVIDGGAGDDTLQGGAGNDTYFFGRGSGHDILSDYDSASGAVDTIQLGTGIAEADVAVGREGDDLLLTIADAGGGDRLQVQSYFSEDGASMFAIERIRFADGSIWDLAAIKTRSLAATAMADSLIGFAGSDLLSGQGGDDVLFGRGGGDTLDGDAGADTLHGEDGDDLLRGGAQDDQLHGGQGDDVLLGGGGNDSLSGGNGADLLDGGAGDDTLIGEAGSDVYAFGHGSGRDTLYEYESDPAAASVDVVQVGAGLAVDDLRFLREGDNLVLETKSSHGGDRLDIQNYFLDDGLSPYAVETIRFADGTVVDYSAVKSRATAASDADDTMIGFAGNDVLGALGGDDIVFGRAGSDVIAGGAGADALHGEDGDDILNGGAQDDQLFGGAGADAMFGDEGDDTLVGGDGDDDLSGGAGSDVLIGEGGSDTYRLARGTGSDTVYEYDAAGSDLDAIRVGPDVQSDQIWFRQVGADLEVSVMGTDDRLLLSNWYGGPAYRVEQFVTQDGKTLLESQVQVLVDAMAAFSPPTSADTSVAAAYPAGLQSLVAVHWQ